MKQYQTPKALPMGLIAGAVLVLSLAEANSAQREGAHAKTETDATAPVVFQSRRDKISYAFGVDLARDLKRQTAEVNPDMVVRALTDSLADKKLVMTDAEVSATLSQFAADQKKDYEHARAMIAEKNRKAAETFVAQNVKKAGVVTLPDGLQYKVLKQGSGKTPGPEDEVVVNYRGTLLDGTEVSNSAKSNKPNTLALKAVIPGLSQALQLMPVGSQWQVFVPPALAYGNTVVGRIGPNAMLIFDLELLSINDKPQIVGKR
jgi:FKBP-type peptidyl-prolyl cis-trans isomerase FklB